MALRLYVRDADGVLEEITTRTPLTGLDIVHHAEEGATAISELEIDDVPATLTVGGHRVFYVTESDTGGFPQSRIWTGYTGIREVMRGPKDQVGASRNWKVQLVDANSLLSRRVMHGADAVRPAETDVARMQALMASHEAGLIDDFRYLSTSDPVDMDEADYTGQYFIDAVRDCAEASGKNYFVTFFEDTSTFSLWYDSAASTAYSSTARLSNDPDDIDDVTTFAIMVDETKLTRDPSRVYSHGYMPYQKSYVYAGRASVAAEFARRDAVMPAVNVKSKTKAERRLNRMLTDMEEEEDRIETSVLVPSWAVNLIREGMRVQFKATHLPGYTAFVWGRVLSKRTKQLADNWYSLGLTMSVAQPAAAGTAVYGNLRLSAGPHSGLVYWTATGDNPQPGYPVEPTVGALTALVDLSPPDAGRIYQGWTIGGTGTIDVTAFLTTGGVRAKAVSYTVTVDIRVNGSSVAQSATATPADGTGFASYGEDITVTASSVAVSNGDVLDVYLTCGPTMPIFKTPRGAGQAGERLEITDGSLA